MMTPRLKLRQRGASLIEILVAVLIVTFGILALAALQANSVRYNKTSELRTVASLLAKDMADRMRANVTGVQVLSYNSSETTYANAASTVANETMANIPTCDYPVVCSAQQIAAIDLAQWRRSLFFGLPQAAAYIQYQAPSVTGGGGASADLWVVWDDSAASGGGSATSTDASNCPPNWNAVNTQVAYNCLSMRVAL
jgi:type IV pilus assembly protein PilV